MTGSILEFKFTDHWNGGTGKRSKKQNHSNCNSFFFPTIFLWRFVKGLSVKAEHPFFCSSAAEGVGARAHIWATSTLPHCPHTSTLPPRLEPQTHPFQSPLQPPLTSRLFTAIEENTSPVFVILQGLFFTWAGSQWAGSLHLFANMRKPIKPSIVAWLTGTSLFLSWEIDLPQASPSPPSSIDNFDRTGGNKETSQVVRLNVPSLM